MSEIPEHVPNMADLPSIPDQAGISEKVKIGLQMREQRLSPLIIHRMNLKTALALFEYLGEAPADNEPLAAVWALLRENLERWREYGFHPEVGDFGFPEGL